MTGFDWWAVGFGSGVAYMLVAAVVAAVLKRRGAELRRP